jgi:BolA protein
MMKDVSVAAVIRRKLQSAFAPDELLIEDESARHAGHAGASLQGETHFRVRIVSREFEGVSRVERQRKIYAVLKDELAGPVHALSFTTLTPDEAA